MPTSTGIRDRVATAGIILAPSTKKTGARLGNWGVLRGFAFGSPTNIDGKGCHFGRHITNGILENTTDGSPSSPCLQVTYPNSFFRFKWSVKAGTHSISVLAKQVANTAPYPSMIVRANPAIGLSSDQVASASGGTGWGTIGPIIATFTGVGVLYVELWNNCIAVPGAAALFDHINIT